MKIRQTVLILAITLGALGAGAEVGYRYEDSVIKHGNPIGKLKRRNEIVYLFQNNDSTAREVYNQEGICIKSDFINAAPDMKEIVEPALEPVQEPMPEPTLEPVQEPMPEPALEPVQEPMPEPKKSYFLWIGLSLLTLLVAIAGFMFKGSKALLLNLKSIGKRKSSLPEPINQQSGSDIKKAVKTSPPREASAKLSRNEICFFNALQEAVRDLYIITFHIQLNRIIDLENPDYEEHIPAYRNLKPVFVDFVLHNPLDTSIAAVILLHDPKTEHAYKIYRRNFLQKILNESNIPLIEINENYEYAKETIKETIFKKCRKNAA